MLLEQPRPSRLDWDAQRALRLSALVDIDRVVICTSTGERLVKGASPVAWELGCPVHANNGGLWSCLASLLWLAAIHSASMRVVSRLVLMAVPAINCW